MTCSDKFSSASYKFHASCPSNTKENCGNLDFIYATPDKQLFGRSAMKYVGNIAEWKSSIWKQSYDACSWKLKVSPYYF